jgi:spore coat protein U-like protein
VQFAVHGDIAQYCLLGQIGDVDFGDLTRPNLQVQTHVRLDCNMPFQIHIEAANGGLTNTAYPKGQGPYAGSLDYTLGVSIPLRRPAAAMLEHSFSSRELLAGRTLSSGDGIALDGMGLTVALGQPAGKAGLLGGEYAETIVITVAPS